MLTCDVRATLFSIRVPADDRVVSPASPAQRRQSQARRRLHREADVRLFQRQRDQLRAQLQRSRRRLLRCVRFVPPTLLRYFIIS